jgi:hypothetical protein
MQLTLITLHTGFVPIKTYAFCISWSVYNYALCVIDLMLMAYGCIERYFLVFHLRFFKKHVILLHYGPLLFCVIYPPILYIGFIVVYNSCQNYFDYTLFTCGGPCYQFEVCLMLHPKSSQYFLMKFFINFLESSFSDLLLICLVNCVLIYAKMYQAIVLLKETKTSDVEDWSFRQVSCRREAIINCREMYNMINFFLIVCCWFI